MEPKIKRKFRTFSLSLTTAVASAAPIRFDDVAGGSFEMGTVATSATTLSVWASEAPESTYGRVCKDGSPVSVTLAPSTSEARVYPFPDECYGVGSVKLVADQAAGTAATLVVMLKG
jgi:hypothetical protein